MQVMRDGFDLAVFHVIEPAERFAVIDNTCPHAGGNLAGGTLSGMIVACPWHDWQFNVTTGVCVHQSTARVRVYPCEVRDGAVFADLAGGRVSLEDYAPPGS